MRKLLLLLLIPTLLLGQYNRDVYMCKYVGKPTVIPITNNTISIDCDNNRVWNGMKNGSWTDITTTKTGQRYLAVGQKGDKGDQGIQGVQGVTGAQGVQGVQGLKGADGKDGVCPSCPPSGGGMAFPFNIVMNTTADNSAALQAAIDDSYITAKPIWVIGIDVRMANGTKIKDDHKYFELNQTGNFIATNSNTWTLFSTDLPVNVAAAEGRNTNRRFVFNNVVFHGQGKAQTMFDLQANEGCVYNNIEGKNLKLGIDNSFGLRSIINNPEFIHCTDGIKSKSAAGKYPDATAENSAPNGTVIRDARSVADGSGNVAFSFADCSLCEIDGVVGEGTKHNVVIDWDCSSSTSTPATMRRIHFEGAQPCGISVVRIKSSTMTHIIDNPNMIKPSLMVEVIPTGGGYPNVKWMNVSNQRVFFDDVNPILKGATGVGWKFENCDSPFVEYKMAKIFTGVQMTKSCVRENGLSRWCIVDPPN